MYDIQIKLSMRTLHALVYLKADRSRQVNCRTISRLERLANFVSKPMGAMARVSHAVNNPGGFLKQFANR